MVKIFHNIINHALVIFTIKLANKKSSFESVVFHMGAWSPPLSPPPLPTSKEDVSCMASQYYWRLCFQKISLLASKLTGELCMHQGLQIRQNCSDDSTEVMEGVYLTPEIFSNKQGATSTPEIFGNKHSFVLTFFATNTIYVNCKCCKP